MDEIKLIEKLRLIEALHTGAATDGERDAAAQALERVRARLREMQATAAKEYQFSMPDLWSRKLFVALLRRYELKPYRYRGQRHSTVMVRVPEQFLDDTLWPEFKELNRTLRSFLDEVTDRVIREGVHGDSSDVEIQGELA